MATLANPQLKCKKLPQVDDLQQVMLSPFALQHMSDAVEGALIPMHNHTKHADPDGMNPGGS
ncbi:hypothetical protein [Bradyrhizobium sp. ORS 111]|uniref:hypothetical protein n=1 Tax=Bradyrhizobium sp. ORS 111 TaxID=1685958 RepID=UPI00388CF29C